MAKDLPMYESWEEFLIPLISRNKNQKQSKEKRSRSACDRSGPTRTHPKFCTEKSNAEALKKRMTVSHKNLEKFISPKFLEKCFPMQRDNIFFFGFDAILRDKIKMLEDIFLLQRIETLHMMRRNFARCLDLNRRMICNEKIDFETMGRAPKRKRIFRSSIA